MHIEGLQISREGMLIIFMKDTIYKIYVYIYIYIYNIKIYTQYILYNIYNYIIYIYIYI